MKGPAERTRANAEAIAAFLAEHGMVYRQVRYIATHDGCPIEPGDAAWLGTELHCQRVTAALAAAVKLGLVDRYRAGSGPYLYSAKPTGDAQ